MTTTVAAERRLATVEIVGAQLTKADFDDARRGLHDPGVEAANTLRQAALVIGRTDKRKVELQIWHQDPRTRISASRAGKPTSASYC